MQNTIFNENRSVVTTALESRGTAEVHAGTGIDAYPMPIKRTPQEKRFRTSGRDYGTSLDSVYQTYETQKERAQRNREQMAQGASIAKAYGEHIEFRRTQLLGSD